MKVVRILSLLVILASSASVAFAQDNAPSAGVLVGFNQSWFATTPKNDLSAKQGFVGGGFAVLLRDRRWKVQPEVQFSQRRVEVAFGGSKATFSTNYVNVSLLLRTKLIKNFYTTQGPQFSIPMRSSLKTSAGTLDVKKNIAGDFSLVVGLGHQFSTRIAIEGRYDAGLKQVEEIPLGNFIKRNRALTFMAVIGF